MIMYFPFLSAHNELQNQIYYNRPVFWIPLHLEWGGIVLYNEYVYYQDYHLDYTDLLL